MFAVLITLIDIDIYNSMVRIFFGGSCKKKAELQRKQKLNLSET